MDWETVVPSILMLLMAFAALVMLSLGIWSLSWPSVKGRIDVSFLDKEPESETHCLAYSYVVGGDSYMGTNLKPWGIPDWVIRSGGLEGPGTGDVLWSGSRDAARWYRPDAVVDVYYCRWRPQWSCLEPGGFIAPIFLGGISAFIYFFLVR